MLEWAAEVAFCERRVGNEVYEFGFGVEPKNMLPSPSLFTVPLAVVLAPYGIADVAWSANFELSTRIGSLNTDHQVKAWLFTERKETNIVTSVKYFSYR